MRALTPTLMLFVLPMAVALAQPPGNPNGPANNFRPGAGPAAGGQPGNPGGPGPRGFLFGPQPNAMFSAIDVDGDGVITARELRKAITQLKKLDADGDGNITLAEASPGGRFGDPNEFANRLMENDKNADGKLTADELPDSIKPMLEGADQNRDGAIDRAELTAHMESVRNRFPGGPGPDGWQGGPGAFGAPGGPAGQPGASQLIGQLMQNDRNGDGKLTADEVPPQAMGLLRGGDQNGDRAIDANELQAIVRRMGGRARALEGELAAPAGGNDRGQRRGEARRKQRTRAESEKPAR